MQQPSTPLVAPSTPATALSASQALHIAQIQSAAASAAAELAMRHALQCSTQADLIATTTQTLKQIDAAMQANMALVQQSVSAVLASTMPHGHLPPLILKAPTEAATEQNL